MTTTPQQSQPTAEQEQLIREVAEKVLKECFSFPFDGFTGRQSSFIYWKNEQRKISPREHLYICSLAEGKMKTEQVVRYEQAINRIQSSHLVHAPEMPPIQERRSVTATATQRCKAILEVYENK